jgi:hypothetical protein
VNHCFGTEHIGICTELIPYVPGTRDSLGDKTKAMFLRLQKSTTIPLYTLVHRDETINHAEESGKLLPDSSDDAEPIIACFGPKGGESCTISWG